MILHFINKFFIGILRPWGKSAFLLSLPHHCRVLDVGCGNNSPYKTKKLCPKCYYTGIDISDYNQTELNCADQYVILNPEKFAEGIRTLGSAYEAVISSHNLEHCDHRGGCLWPCLIRL